MLKILRLRFQSDWLWIITSIDSPEWRRRQPPEITQWMLGLLDHWKLDLSGEIYEWGWVDTLARSTPSQPEADFRGVDPTAEDDVDLHGCDDAAA